MIPSTDGGYWIREYGVYDDDDNLLGICKCAETYKPIISDGSVKEMLLDMVLCVINTDVVELKIDPTIIFAKKSDIIKLENKIENINWTKAMGTQNDLLNRTFIAKYNNDNTKATTINGLPLYKANSTNNVTLKKGRAYTVWYSASDNCFFLKASATGDAKAGEVLAGKIVSTDEDTDIIGTMPNNPKITKTLKVGESYTVPKGYNNGSVIKAETIKDASKSSGVTLNLAGELLKDVKAFDKDGNLITGTATIESLGGIEILYKLSYSHVEDTETKIKINYDFKVGDRIVDFYKEGGAFGASFKGTYPIYLTSGTTNGVKIIQQSGINYLIVPSNYPDRSNNLMVIKL